MPWCRKRRARREDVRRSSANGPNSRTSPSCCAQGREGQLRRDGQELASLARRVGRAKDNTNDIIVTTREQTVSVLSWWRGRRAHGRRPRLGYAYKVLIETPRCRNSSDVGRSELFLLEHALNRGAREHPVKYGPRFGRLRAGARNARPAAHQERVGIERAVALAEEPVLPCDARWASIWSSSVPTFASACAFTSRRPAHCPRSPTARGRSRCSASLQGVGHPGEPLVEMRALRRARAGAMPACGAFGKVQADGRGS